MNLNEDCLISKEPIINKITLPCNHSYEYQYLYEEIKQQKQRHKSYFKCPYCRTMYTGTIPYINGNDRTVIPILKCEWNNCNFSGNKFKHGNYCWKHMKSVVLLKCGHICKNGSTCKNNQVNEGPCRVHTKKENK
jgi:hypothetical protein